MRSATGLLRSDIKQKERYARKHITYMAQRQWLTPYLPWARRDKAKLMSAINTVNRHYRRHLAYGDLKKFYNIGMHTVQTKEAFTLSVKRSNAVIAQRKSAGVYHMAHLGAAFQLIPHLQMLHSEDGFSSETNRSRIGIEEGCLMDHRMSTLHLMVCQVCHTDRLMFSTVRLKNKHTCERCQREKLKDDYYLRENLLPIWYEHDMNGKKKIGKDGKFIVHENIPDELYGLTVSEKLLIRRVAPFVPAVHMKHGVPGIKGHCICFPQDITEVCRTLPTKHCTILTYIRRVGNSNTQTEIDHQELKVRRDKVMAALIWLKQNNCAYHDIIIDPKNLDWMEGKDVGYIDTANHGVTFKEGVENVERVTVSEVQCPMAETEGQEEFNYSVPVINEMSFQPAPGQKELMTQLLDTAKESNGKTELLKFPPIDTSDPIS